MIDSCFIVVVVVVFLWGGGGGIRSLSCVLNPSHYPVFSSIPSQASGKDIQSDSLLSLA